MELAREQNGRDCWCRCDIGQMAGNGVSQLIDRPTRFTFARRGFSLQGFADALPNGLPDRAFCWKMPENARLRDTNLFGQRFRR